MITWERYEHLSNLLWGGASVICGRKSGFGKSSGFKRGILDIMCVTRVNSWLARMTRTSVLKSL